MRNERSSASNIVLGNRSKIIHRRENGQSMVEFALVLPILLLLVCGIIEFGMCFAQILSVQNYAREGARYASIHSDEEVGDIVHAVEEMADQNPFVNDPSASVDFSDSEVTGAPQVSVTLTATINSMTPIGYLIFGGSTKPISATVTMYIYVS